VKGGIALKQYFGDKALSVFVSPPSLEVLEKRLRNRKTETEEEILKRINKAEEEMTDKDAFDMVLINEDLDTTCQQAMEFVGDFLEQ
jgi:guanylate kinase